MSAGVYPILIEQGADWRLEFVWKNGAGNPHNLDGWNARMQIRDGYASKTKIIDINTETGGIVLGGAYGTVELLISAEVTQAVAINPTKFVWQDGKQGQLFAYDLELIDPQGMVKRLMQGAVFFVPEVTK